MRARLTYANVMATIAVFIALGGGAIAAVTLKKRQVKNRHLATGAVSSRVVRDGTLLLGDFKSGQLPGTPGAPGSAGSAGPTGPQGPPGENGTNGTNGAPGANGAGLVVSGVRTTPAAITATPPTPFQVFSSPDVAWTQPPGALDTIHGFMRVGWGTECDDPTDYLEVQLVETVDNVELSTDLPLVGSVDTPGNTAPDADGVRIGTTRRPGGSSFGDEMPLPFELTSFTPPAVATDRNVEIRMRKDCGAGSGAPNTVTVSEIRIFVTRFVG